MAKITINGSSYDLVEIGGDIREEFSPSETDGFIIACSDGTVLKGEYDDDGMWRFKGFIKGSAEMTKVEADDPDENYSDVVTLVGDIKWVALASALAN